MNSFPRNLVEQVRKVLGTRRIHEQFNAARDIARVQQVSAYNTSQFNLAPPEELARSPVVQRTRAIVASLAPADVADARYVRVGNAFDGGYVMLDHALDRLDAAYSFGISNDVTWDEQMAERGITIHMYDHTIPSLPKTHPRFRFSRTGVCGLKTGPHLRTLHQCLQDNGHEGSSNLVLKIDVEGAEWDVLEEVPSNVLGQFQQIVIEFHSLTDAAYEPVRFAQIGAALTKLNETHQVVHLHANAVSALVQIRRLVLPSIMEVTYVRRRDFQARFIANTRVFPTALDAPTYPGYPDLYLGGFTADAT